MQSNYCPQNFHVPDESPLLQTPTHTAACLKIHTS